MAGDHRDDNYLKDLDYTNLVGIPNGADPEMLGVYFNQSLQEAYEYLKKDDPETYKNPLDLERPATAKLYWEAKKRAREKVNRVALVKGEDGIRTATGHFLKLAEDNPKVLSLVVRAVPEKIGRGELHGEYLLEDGSGGAFSNENIRAFVKAGWQVVIVGADQKYSTSSKVADDLANLENEIMGAKEQGNTEYAGSFFYVRNLIGDVKKYVFGASILHAHCTYPNTEANGYTESPSIMGLVIDIKHNSGNGALLDQGTIIPDWGQAWGSGNGNTLAVKNAEGFKDAVLEAGNKLDENPDLYAQHCFKTPLLNSVMDYFVASWAYLYEMDKIAEIKADGEKDNDALINELEGTISSDDEEKILYGSGIVRYGEEKDTGFVWKTENGVVRTSGPSLAGFVAGDKERRLKDGTKGLWAFAYHADRNDILTYLDRILRNAPESLNPVKNKIADLKKRAAIAISVKNDENTKLSEELSRQGIELVSKLVNFLEITGKNLDVSWWRSPLHDNIPQSVPIFALRRETKDPGIGKFTDLGRYYVDVLKKQGINVVLLLPHFAVSNKSPYEVVSPYAFNELYIDWSVVEEVEGNGKLLMKLLPTIPQEEVDYGSVREREDPVALEGSRHFYEQSPGSNRRKTFEKWKEEIGSEWLEKINDYSEYMAISEILNKPSLDWTAEEVEQAKQASRDGYSYQDRVNRHLYAQWIAYNQFKDAVAVIHEHDGKVLFDVPLFRGKNSVDVWKHPEYFKDLASRNPGIVREGLNENWKELAQWNWTELKKDKNGKYNIMLNPFRYWLDFGLDGTRVDALHFAYNFGNGQFVSGDEPGDDYVKELAKAIIERDGLPLAEAFEGKDADANKLGFITVQGDWENSSNHDDPRKFNTLESFEQAFIKSLNRNYSGRNARFISSTLGDQWGDPKTVKGVMKNGSYQWDYRIPMKSDKDYNERVRFDIGPFIYNVLHPAHVWESKDSTLALFKSAANSFVKQVDGKVQIWASGNADVIPKEWGRDTFISLPGLLLATGRFDDAKNCIRKFADKQHKKNGLIPNRVFDDQHIEYNSVDSSMWFIQAVKKYVEYTGDWKFVEEMLPAIHNIMEGYQNGTEFEIEGKKYKIYMDEDGLIVSPAQTSWMNTARNGKAVEINALWYANIQFMEELERRAGNAVESGKYEELAAKVKVSFNDKFWNKGYENDRSATPLFDVVEGDPHGRAIRPNMLIAVSHGGDLLSFDRQKVVLNTVTKELLTPYGLRTLSTRDSYYHPYYNALDHHQGAAWPWLIGPYVDALVRVRRHDGVERSKIQSEIQKILTPLTEALATTPGHSISEVYDGSPRDVGNGKGYVQQPAGAGSKAWSVAEVLRVLIEQGILKNGIHIQEKLEQPVTESTQKSSVAPEKMAELIIEIFKPLAIPTAVRKTWDRYTSEPAEGGTLNPYKGTIYHVANVVTPGIIRQASELNLLGSNNIIVAPLPENADKGNLSSLKKINVKTVVAGAELTVAVSLWLGKVSDDGKEAPVIYIDLDGAPPLGECARSLFQPG